MTDYQATETQPLLRRRPVQGAWHRTIVVGACAVVGCVAIAAVSARTVTRRPLAAAAPSEISDETVQARSVGNERARSGVDVSTRAAGSRTSAMGNSEVFHESSWASDAWETIDFLHWFHRDRHAQEHDADDEPTVEAPPSPLSPPPPSPPPLDFHHVHFPHVWPGTKGCQARCESKFVDQSQCEGMFYCEWDGERCWSAVGDNHCPEDEREMREMLDRRAEKSSHASALGNSETSHENDWGSVVASNAASAWETIDFLHWFHRDHDDRDGADATPPSPLSPPPPSPPPLDFHHVDFPHTWPGTKGCQATCESEYVDQSQCEGKFYCEWDGERCWSAVGDNHCPEDEGEMQSMFDSRDEKIAGGDDDPDHHTMYHHEYPGMNGCEMTCEGDGVSEEFCKSNFFCEWDGARCWSAVGPYPCPADDAEMQSFWLQSYGGDSGESKTPHQRPAVDEHPDSAPRGCEVECEAQSTASACGDKFYCTWDGHGCWSSVGAEPCPGTQDEMFAAWDAFAEQLADGYPGQSGCALECEGDDVDADACSGKFYCAFFAGKCFSIVGEDECPASEEDMFDDMYADNGFDHGHHHDYPGTSGCEAACEGENVDEATCATRFYCTWDAADGRCWSAVGSEDCPTSEEDMYAMFRDNAAGSTAALGAARNAVRRGVARKVATR